MIHALTVLLLIQDVFFVETNVRKTISKLFEVVIRAWPRLGFVFSLYAAKLGTRLIRGL